MARTHKLVHSCMKADPQIYLIKLEGYKNMGKAYKTKEGFEFKPDRDWLLYGFDFTCTSETMADLKERVMTELVRTKQLEAMRLSSVDTA